ncbi:MAG TPA: CoA transferase [Stellaceae bacterium]|jgi:crotonobetainyl-CoA:carnitine CoA-transferase CaiB-like acyl-CoA transferase
MTKPGPLAGIRVVDLTAVVLGPLATQILGDLGAEVIKVEPPEGDIMRYAGPARHREMGHVFLNLNRNKRSLALDLKRPEGAAALLALVRRSDVLMHNMRPQAMARLGFAYDRLREVNPRLVYCSAHGYGQDGPLADNPAFDDIIQGASGFVALQEATGGEARFVPTLVGDKTVGLTMAYAVMAALLQRARTGEGQMVEVPMLETMTAFVMAEHLGGLTFDPPLGPPGYARMLAPDRRPHRTADGHICILPYTDRQWRDFFRIAGRPELADDPRLADAQSRSRHIAELYALIAECVRAETSAHWLATLKSADIPCGPVNRLAELPQDEQLAAVDFFPASDHPSEGRIRMVRPPLRFSEADCGLRHPAPRLGQHSREILGEAGLGAAEIEDLIARKIAIAPA